MSLPRRRPGGYRERDFDTRFGALNLRIPKLRQGSYFPPFPENRKNTQKALVAVIQEAWAPDRVRGRRLDGQGGRIDQGNGPVQNLEVVGVQAVRRYRRAGGCLSQPAAEGRMALPLVGRRLHKAARGRPQRRGCGDNRPRPSPGQALPPTPKAA